MSAMDHVSAVPPPVAVTVAPRTFEDFFAAEWQRSVRLAYLLLRSQEAAEEVCQEAFVRVHQRWNRLQHPTAYLRAAIVNRCNDGLRRRLRWEQRVHLLASDASVEHSGLSVELLDALHGLPLKQRAAIILRYWGGLSEREIAEAIGVQPGTVRSLVHRGIQQLRQQMQEDEA